MQNILIKTTFPGLLFCLSTTLFAQDAYIIRCLDNTTAKPISGIEVWREDSLIATSNVLGYFSATGRPEERWTLKHPAYFPHKLTLPDARKFHVKLEFKGDSLLFSEGMEDFYMQIAKKMRYPSVAMNAGFQGTCIAQISIDEAGGTVLEKIIGPGCKTVRSAIKNVFKKLDGSLDASHTGEQIMIPFVFQITGLEPPPPTTQPRDPAYKHLAPVVVTAYRTRY